MGCAYNRMHNLEGGAWRLLHAFKNFILDGFASFIKGINSGMHEKFRVFHAGYDDGFSYIHLRLLQLHSLNFIKIPTRNGVFPYKMYKSSMTVPTKAIESVDAFETETVVMETPYTN